MNIKFSRSLFSILQHFRKSLLYMILKIILIRKYMQMFHYHLNSRAARGSYCTAGYTEATENSPVVSRDDVTFHSAILAFPSRQPWFMPTRLDVFHFRGYYAMITNNICVNSMDKRLTGLKCRYALEAEARCGTNCFCGLRLAA
jgi:hypothetical protein